MTEAEFHERVAEWIARNDAEALSGERLAAFRALCERQAALHSSATCRALFGRAAALPVITRRVASALSPFVEAVEQ